VVPLWARSSSIKHQEPMVRKHSAWTRLRQRAARPKTPAPTAGWVISELSRLTGVPVRRLRDYVTRGLIRPLERRGTATRYARSQLVRLLAVTQLRTEGAQLSAIKQKLDTLGERELEDWLHARPLPPAALAALSLPAPGSADSGSAPAEATAATPPLTAKPPVAGPHAPPAGGAPLHAAVGTWYHVELLPGLVLHCSTTASPAVKAAAQRIYDEYLGR
jgi:DNA-binding transcriptional MerR regulator